MKHGKEQRALAAASAGNETYSYLKTSEAFTQHAVRSSRKWSKMATKSSKEGPPPFDCPSWWEHAHARLIPSRAQSEYGRTRARNGDAFHKSRLGREKSSWLLAEVSGASASLSQHANPLSSPLINSWGLVGLLLVVLLDKQMQDVSDGEAVSWYIIIFDIWACVAFNLLAVILNWGENKRFHSLFGSPFCAYSLNH